MKGLLKFPLLVLPLLVMLAIVGWLVIGGLPDVQLTGDLMSWLAELPILTCYAMATLVGAMAGMNITGMNIDNAARLALMHRAAGGNFEAYRIVRHEALCWFTWLAVSAFYFWPAR